MNKIIKRKHHRVLHRLGFTLLEMVLVIAIMLMMATYVYSTFKIVNYSHLEVTVVNDMHDYASLNLQAIANNLCNATSIGGDATNKTIGLSEDGAYVTLNGNKILNGFTQYHTGNNLAKWGVNLEFYVHATSKTVLVKIYLSDNSAQPASVVYYDQMYVYCPGCSTWPEVASDEALSTLSFSTDLT